MEQLDFLLLCIQNACKKNNQRGFVRKLKKEEQSLLYAACHPDIIRIPVKLHEDIPNSY